jgi:dipeptidase E
MASLIRILALSSSKVGDSGFLESYEGLIKSFLPNKKLKIAFIPFASAGGNYNEYGERVRAVLRSHELLVTFPENAKEIIDQSDTIMIGGGNTFKLLHDLYEFDLVELIRRKIATGVPYIGWSAGANVAGATIGTTNDMPVTEPKSFKSLSLLPFQINPHYINQTTEKFNGETRDQRLEEFLIMNPSGMIAALPEGTALRREGDVLKFIGDEGYLFYRIKSVFIKKPLAHDEDLSFLLK